MASIKVKNSNNEWESVAIANVRGFTDVEPIVLTGDCQYACNGNIAGAYIKNFGDKISTNNITDTKYMFFNSSLSSIPFEINCGGSERNSCTEMFSGCRNLIEVPKINNFTPYNIGKFFKVCLNLRYLPEDFGANWDWTE